MKRHIAKAVNKDGTSCSSGAGISEVIAHVHQVYLEKTIDTSRGAAIAAAEFALS